VYRYPRAVFLATVRSNDDTGSTLLLSGELDLAAAPEFRRALRSLGSGPGVVVDLSGVTFLDSVGVGLLIGADRRAREANGRLTVVVGPGAARQMLVACGVDRIVSIVDPR
jgi:anti-sigma B factor antagonist